MEGYQSVEVQGPLRLMIENLILRQSVINSDMEIVQLKREQLARDILASYNINPQTHDFVIDGFMLHVKEKEEGVGPAATAAPQAQ
jgi:hypothetical protein